MKRVLLLVAASVAVLLVLGSVLALRARSEAEGVVDDFMARLQQGDDAAAYRLMGERLRRRVDYRRFQQWRGRVREALGACRQRSQSGVRLRGGSGGVEVVLAYDAVFDKGNAVLRFAVERGPDGWRLLGVHCDSPRFAPLAVGP